MNHQRIPVNHHLVDQILTAVFRAIVRFARAKLDIWDHRLVVDQNVLLVRSVITVLHV